MATRSARSLADLAAHGLVTGSDDLTALEAVAGQYAIAISPAMVTLARTNPAIAAQFVPSTAELTQRPEERDDPIGDGVHSPVKGIVHRYPDRVLLKLTHTCPVYCRFCFRREMVGPEGHGTLDATELDAAVAYIAATPAIFEVIITGGDPLVLSPRRIADVSRRLGDIRHVKAIRWHSRVPVVQPEAVTEEMLTALKAGGKAVYVAVHANHPAEFTAAAQTAMARLVDGGIVLLSQSVLLKGVNADIATLEALMRCFVANRIRAYYLHHPDLAPGTGHFRLTFDEGLALMDELRRRVSGLALPNYVIDIPGGYGKVPVATARKDGDGWLIPDRAGVLHRYP